MTEDNALFLLDVIFWLAILGAGAAIVDLIWRVLDAKGRFEGTDEL